MKMVEILSFTLAGIGALALFFLIVYAASFAIPTGAMFFIISLGASLISFIDYFWVVLITLLATIAGDISTYLVSRIFREKIHGFLSKYKWFLKREKEAQRQYHKHGAYAVFITRFFAAPIGPFLNYISGFQKLKFRKFFVAVVSGEIIYSASYVGFGFFFKETWRDLIVLVNDFTILFVLIVVLGFILYKLLGYCRRKKKCKIKK